MNHDFDDIMSTFSCNKWSNRKISRRNNTGIRKIVLMYCQNNLHFNAFKNDQFLIYHSNIGFRNSKQATFQLYKWSFVVIKSYRWEPVVSLYFKSILDARFKLKWYSFSWLFCVYYLIYSPFNKKSHVGDNHPKHVFDIIRCLYKNVIFSNEIDYLVNLL